MGRPATAPVLARIDRLLVIGSVAGLLLSGLAHFGRTNHVVTFVLSALTIALLAALIGRGVDHLGSLFGPGTTGVLHSALGNLPELFIGIFALRAGLIDVVRAAIVGSILANALLVLGLAFLVGGLRHGVQRFNTGLARDTITLLILAVAALLVPSMAAFVHTPAAEHETELSVIVSVILLTVFVLSVPQSLRHQSRSELPLREETGEEPTWPVWLAITLLGGASVGAALASEWFIDALTPAVESLGISRTFAGLVIVAIAGNAVEHIVGVRLAARNHADYAVSVIINSPSQIALVLAPALVLLSHVLGGAVLTLVFAPLLVASLALTVITVSVVILDGESVWLEGVALLGLYAVISASFWWG